MSATDSKKIQEQIARAESRYSDALEAYEMNKISDARMQQAESRLSDLYEKADSMNIDRYARA